MRRALTDLAAKVVNEETEISRTAAETMSLDATIRSAAEDSVVCRRTLPFDTDTNTDA
jgi:hypothetical protein